MLVDKKLIENNEALRLSNIQCFGIIFKSSEDVKLILLFAIKLDRLRSLSMNLEPLFQCRRLSKLKLIGPIKEYPHQSHHILKFLPPSIVKLTLRFSELTHDPMGVLERLPCLTILNLQGFAYEGRKMICSANGFPQLDSLCMDYAKNLEV
ncbi:putative disease resistance protein RF9 [Gossypium australe]|uniref:Putative disease resistance protein RF9 n=1 Tax=Gossypium australe TaxID=47621 RepID=A0A5B6WKK6_9ROSI|nr:putative disease resistance protein RF9 [Gossypium australe]